MALPIDVSSVEVLQEVREALLLFGDDAKNALGATEMEIRRCIDWLTNDQRIHWQNEIKKRKEKLSEAKAELSRKQLSSMTENAQDSEQREKVREAKHRLEEAEDKLETVRGWIPELQRAVMEYDGVARGFGDMLEFDLLRSVEMMERMIIAIEEYTALQAPQTNPGGGSASTTSAPTATTATVPTATVSTAAPAATPAEVKAAPAADTSGPPPESAQVEAEER